jgi:DnaK suppressor protein
MPQADRRFFNPEQEDRLRKTMESRRKDLLETRRNIQSSWETLHEPAVEIEEMAQQEHLAQPEEFLDTLEKDEIEQIDMALRKIGVGSYGICEGCGRRIAGKRLDALPWTPLCGRCAHRREREDEDRLGLDAEQTPGTLLMREGGSRAPNVSVEPRIGLPEDFAGMSDPDIEEQLWSALEDDGRVELDELEIASHKGVIHLEGFLPSEEKHQILIQILQDELDLHDYVDNIRMERLDWEREDLPQRQETTTKTEEEVLLQGEDVESDAFESRTSGEPLNPPDELIPDKER